MGYECFFERDLLEMSDYLLNDCLKIYCNVGIIVSGINSSRSCSLQVPASNMGSHLSVLLKNMEGCDITFNVSDEKIHAHKLILAARSPKLCSDLLEGVNTEEVMVPDMEPKVFRALLHFIYTDTLAENEVIASAPSVADSVTAKLLAVADRYDLERLKRLCESYLCNYITVNSAIQVLVLADRYHAAELENFCLKFAASNLTAVMRWVRFEYREENWSSLKCELLSAVGGCDEDCT
ncbi:hypothetical protein OROHE_012291 [Orobanche hederae]